MPKSELSSLQEMISSGQSVGGIVSFTIHQVTALTVIIMIIPIIMIMLMVPAAHIEDRPDPEQSSLQEMTSRGHSVGGIVDVTIHQVTTLTVTIMTIL